MGWRERHAPFGLRQLAQRYGMSVDELRQRPDLIAAYVGWAEGGNPKSRRAAAETFMDRVDTIGLDKTIPQYDTMTMATSRRIGIPGATNQVIKGYVPGKGQELIDHLKGVQSGSAERILPPGYVGNFSPAAARVQQINPRKWTYAKRPDTGKSVYVPRWAYNDVANGNFREIGGEYFVPQGKDVSKLNISWSNSAPKPPPPSPVQNPAYQGRDYTLVGDAGPQETVTARPPAENDINAPLTKWPFKVALPGTPPAAQPTPPSAGQSGTAVASASPSTGQVGVSGGGQPDVEIGMPSPWVPDGAPASGGGFGAGSGTAKGGFAAPPPNNTPIQQARPVPPPTQMARAVGPPSVTPPVNTPGTAVAATSTPPLRGTVTPGPQPPPPTAVASAPTPPPPPPAPAAPPTEAMPAQGAFSMAGLGKGLAGLAGAFGGGNKQQEQIAQMQAKMNQDAISYEEQRAQQALEEMLKRNRARRMA